MTARALVLLEAIAAMEAVISNGDVAEVAAPVPGEVGRAAAVAARDDLLEEPVEWLRKYAAEHEEPRSELADFGPEGHLLETCLPLFDGYQCLGNAEPMPDHRDCASILYAIAQDAELALAQVRALCDEWEALQKGPGPTTDRIRAALEVNHG